MLLPPLSYHRHVRDYLKQREPELWRWFSSARAKETHAEALRLELLKSTYRLTPEQHPECYAALSAASRALGVDVPVTLYQAQTSSSQPNAGLYALSSEAHIVFSGPLTTLLDAEELAAVLGHELAHFQLLQLDQGEFAIAERVLDAAASDRGAHPAHRETTRRFRLYTEIYADRGGFKVTPRLPVVVAALVKTSTGLASVRGESYLAQAEEIFSRTAIHTTELTHPESFIRARALALWADQGEATEPAIDAMIGGQPSLDQLDLFGQNALEILTRRFLGQLLRPRWFHSDTVLAHARLFFPDFTPAEADDPSVADAVRATGPLVRDYFAPLLLDFAHVDRELDDVPLAAALRWAEILDMADAFERLAQKDLGWKPRDLSKLKTRAAELLIAAEKVL